MLSCLLTLLISMTLPDDTGLARFCAPLDGEPQTISITASQSGFGIDNARTSISLTAGSVTPDGLRIDTCFYPLIQPNRWGYPDEAVYGRFESRFLGLKIFRSVHSATQVLDAFNAWTRGMTPAQIPSFTGLDRASIESDTEWTLPLCLRLTESLFRLVPSLDHASIEIKPIRGKLSVRAVGMVSTITGPDSTVAQMLIQISPRPASRPAGFLANENVGPNTRAFLFTTDAHLINVEVTPADAVIDDLAEWRSLFPAP